MDDEYGPFDLRLAPFTTLQIVGKSFSGKTTLSLQIALKRKQVYQDPPEKVVYFYKNWQKGFKDVQERDDAIVFCNTKEQVEEELKGEGHKLLILDDYMSVAITKENEYITEFFTDRCHHEKISLIFLSQLLYPKNGRCWALNTQYYAFFKNPHQQQINIFFRNINPRLHKFLIDSYTFCTDQRFGHFFMSLYGQTDDTIRFRNSVIPYEGMQVFLPKEDGENNKPLPLSPKNSKK